MYKVVLVDDEVWAIRGMKQVFPWKKYNFEVVEEYTDSFEALEGIVDICPDVVFTDIRMAGASGLDLIRELKNRIQTEYVIVSAYRDFDYARSAIEAEVIEYCVKPVSPQDAEKVLDKLKKRLDKKYGLIESDDLINVCDIDVNKIQNEKFKRMIVYIMSNYDRKLRLNKMATQFGLNENYCTTLFAKYFNCGFSQFVNELRVNKAADLLKNTELSINEVAELCGYDDYPYFSKIFKKQIGLPPREYANKYRNNV